MRLVGIVVQSRTRSFAAMHVGANVTFARGWFGNEWISAIHVWRVCFSKHGGCWDVFVIAAEVEDI